MLEANKKLMQQLLQGMSQSNGTNQPTIPTNTNPKTRREPIYQDWQIVNVGPKIEKDGKNWWWCPNHRKGQCLYIRHKPENHKKWKDSFSKMNRYIDRE